MREHPFTPGDLNGRVWSSTIKGSGFTFWLWMCYTIHYGSTTQTRHAHVEKRSKGFGLSSIVLGLLSAAKDDRLDALAQAHLLRTDRHRFKPLAPAPEQYRRLDRLCLDLRKLIDDKTRLSNQITSCLALITASATFGYTG